MKKIAYDIKIKKFYDGRVAYQIAQNPIVGKKKKEKILGDGQRSELSEEENIARSLRRTKDAIYDCVHNNPWEYFITVTFDSKKVDRYNWEEVRKKHSKMLNNLKSRKCPTLEYLFVPELHKDGAVHFHGLLMGTHSLTLLKTALKDSRGRNVYNCKEFNLGFNTLTRITDPSKAATYVTKYITKEVIDNLSGKKYWTSRGLNKVEVDKIFVGHSEQKKELINDLFMDENLAGFHRRKIELDEYQNTYTYIVTHPGADGSTTRSKFY